jgi:hypothetical protein
MSDTEGGAATRALAAVTPSLRTCCEADRLVVRQKLGP